ncbi:lipopolysaccharide biosynthesis protein [Niveispirillum sp. KHB5.9]|uniref:lipopolysaccharide biosynthesis protein n=1 Tax=Niveispirillum sp. KHB5.9 TaxID=3400269 RepID=UPI003A8B6BFB
MTQENTVSVPGRLSLSPLVQMRRLRDGLAARPFLRNVSIMLSGAAGGQLISLLLAPVLTRLYSPQQFGILSVYLAALTMLTVIASLRYELALPLVRRQGDAINLTFVCLCVLTATTTLLGVAVFTVPDVMVHDLWPVPLEGGQLTLYRWLFIIGYACLGGYYIALQLATRAGDFPAIAKTRLAQGLVGPGSQIGLALVGAATPGLLAGSVLGQSAGTLGLFGTVLNRRRLRLLSWRRMRMLANRYIRFPLIASWAALIDAAGSSQLLYLLVGLFYSPYIAGFIFLVERVVSRPLAIVGTSILQVYIGEAGKIAATDPARLMRRFRQVVSRQFMLALAWAVAANIAATFFFAAVFGPEWQDGVLYLRAMSIGYLAQALVQPVFHTLQLLEKQAMAAGWQVGRLCLTVAVFMGGYGLGLEPHWVITGYSAAQAVCCLALLGLMARAIGQRQKGFEG